MDYSSASQLITKIRSSVTEFFASLWREEDGQDLVEYSLLLGFVAIASMAALGGVKTSVTGIWGSVNRDLSSAVAAS
jgi:Flp pilus assembly pilin Flp